VRELVGDSHQDLSKKTNDGMRLVGEAEKEFYFHVVVDAEKGFLLAYQLLQSANREMRQAPQESSQFWVSSLRCIEASGAAINAIKL
jgi:hypothetical protein